MQNLRDYFRLYMPVFNQELIKFVEDLLNSSDPQLFEIFKYHLGLDLPADKQGKRLRPFLVFLCTQGAGEEWQSAMPAALAVELVHNFSLIHDDIEDNGLTRRSQEAVWVKWGLPIALNAGDAMFAAAFKALNNSGGTLRVDRGSQMAELLASTCMQLTEGQHLDLVFETRESVSVSEYFRMIERKTAALFACCTQLGALIGEADKEEIERFRKFGGNLGISFQIYDDWLGVWGDAQQTGKSSYSDLVEGKRSLPVLFGLEQSNRFSERWQKKAVSESDATLLAEWLHEDGVELRVREEFAQWHKKTLDELNQLNCSQSVKMALLELCEQLSIREK